MDELEKNQGEELEVSTDETNLTDQESDIKPINSDRILLLAGLIVVIVLIIIVGSRFFGSSDPAPAPVVDSNSTGFATDKNEVIQNEKYLAGQLKNITFTSGTEAGVITVKAGVLDVSTDKDFIQEADRVFQEKEFAVRFDASTQFENKTAKDLVPGDILNIDTTESIYLSTDLVASQVVFYDQQAVTKNAILANNTTLYGEVKVKNTDSLVVSVEIVDVEALNEMDLSSSYSVPLVTKEVTVGVDTTDEQLASKLDAIKVGDTVDVTTAENIYEATSLSATRISIIKLDDGRY